jgi:hypothetical protein
MLEVSSIVLNIILSTMFQEMRVSATILPIAFSNESHGMSHLGGLNPFKMIPVSKTFLPNIHCCSGCAVLLNPPFFFSRDIPIWSRTV